MNLEDGQIETVFTLSEFPELDDTRRFSTSPNGKMVLLRCVLENDIGDDKSVFVLWDGQNRKIIETDSWLIEPKLPLQELDYEEVSEMLKNSPVLLKRRPMDTDYVFDGIRVEP